MSDSEFNKIFAKRLKYYLALYGMSQKDLAKRLGVSETTISNWTQGTKSPRMSKVDLMCQIFHCKRSDFMEDIQPDSQPAATTESSPIDIDKYLNRIIESQTLLNDGQPIDDDSLELLKGQMKIALQTIQMRNNKK